MPSWTEVLGDETIDCEEALGVPWRFEPLHAPFALACRLVRVLGAIIQIAVLPVFDARQHLPFRCAIAFQLIGHEATMANPSLTPVGG